MPEERPVLSFVVPVRNDAENLRRCLASIRASSASTACEIIVLDNGSTDDSARVANDAGARAFVIAEGSVADLRNSAARLARADLLAFVDADHEIDPGWTSGALELMRDPSVAAAGCQYRAPSAGTWVQRMYDRLRRHEPGCRDVDWLPSGNLVVRKSAFDSIGGFDTSLETCEDVDFCQRLVASGGRLLSTDRMRSVHRGDPPTLAALFFGELWRGRDNLRVSLRAPVTWRSMPSIAIPIANLLALLAVAVGVPTLPFGGAVFVSIGVAVFGLLTSVRAASLLWQAEPVDRSIARVTQALIVAAVYNTARSLALVVRSGADARRSVQASS
jgi:GT2 family glycosyltransferase